MPNQPRLQQVPLDRVTQTIYARIHVMMAAMLHDVGHAAFGHTLEGVIGKFQDSLPRLDLACYNAMRERLGVVVGELGRARGVELSKAAREMGRQLVVHDLPRVAAIATKLNEEEAPKFFAAIRPPEGTFEHFAIDTKRKTTIRRGDFDRAIEQIVNRRLGEFADLIKRDTALWLAEQGVGGGDVGFDGGGEGARYALRNGGGIWKIVFDWKGADWKDEKGLRYVAYLVKHPPAQPIHGTKLAAQVFGYADVPELSLGKEDESTQRAIEKEAKELASVIRSAGASDLEKREARERLEELAKVRKVAGKRPESNAEKTVRAVRKAIHRLHKKLASAKDGGGRPHPVYRPFAEHILKHIIIPSARYSGRRGARTKAGVAGCFTYERPEGVEWTVLST